MKYIDIPTRFEGLRTYKVDDTPYFRPASTGFTKEEIIKRLHMEALEVEASSRRGGQGYISSAAHWEEKEAVNNALNEATERVSLAYWWVTRTGSVARLNSRHLSELRGKYSVPQEFRLSIGFVESVTPDRYVAVSILDDRLEYPFSVLGGACSDSLNSAAEKAFIESVQSWSASRWLYQHPEKRKYSPMWDIGELRKRAEEIDSLSDKVSESDQFWLDTESPSFRVVTESFNSESWVAWVYGERATSGTSQDLASLAMKETGIVNISVYTQHNF